jgi:hypothetical protein
VRAYARARSAPRTLARAAGTDPTGNHGCLADFVTAAGLLTIVAAPVCGLTNMDAPVVQTIYFAIQNLDAGAGVVTVDAHDPSGGVAVARLLRRLREPVRADGRLLEH